MEIRPHATPTTAALTGAYSALVGLALGPLVDSPGSHSGFWLLLAVALVAIPSHFFVFGIPGSQVIGLWRLHPDLLKRIGAWLAGGISAASVAAVVQAVLPSAT